MTDIRYINNPQNTISKPEYWRQQQIWVRKDININWQVDRNALIEKQWTEPKLKEVRDDPGMSLELSEHQSYQDSLKWDVLGAKTCYSYSVITEPKIPARNKMCTEGLLSWLFQKPSNQMSQHHSNLLFFSHMFLCNSLQLLADSRKEDLLSSKSKLYISLYIM